MAVGGSPWQLWGQDAKGPELLLEDKGCPSSGASFSLYSPYCVFFSLLPFYHAQMSQPILRADFLLAPPGRTWARRGKLSGVCIWELRQIVRLVGMTSWRELEGSENTSYYNLHSGWVCPTYQAASPGKQALWYPFFTSQDLSPGLSGF